jgi:C-3',4' desaturase CrtD
MRYDFIVVGSGMGGLSAASLLQKHGLRTLVLEASHLPGGCASSYPIKHGERKFIFEAGATTIIGLDKHQPLGNLAAELGITFPVTELDPSMTVHISGKNVVRYKNKNKWINECHEKFFSGTTVSQRQVKKFWRLVFALSDFAWLASERNRNFPPKCFPDYVQLVKANSILDFPKLRYLFRSTFDVIKSFGLDASPDFVRFCDEQLIITSQSKTRDTAFLYAAPCLAYTTSSNYYAYGGIIKLAETVIEKFKQQGGNIMYREEVKLIEKTGNGFKVTTQSGKTFESKNVVSNVPIWNMVDLTKGRISEWFQALSRKFSFGWGAFTMSVAVESSVAENLTLHHQFILDEKIPHCESNSFFVSLSMPDDHERQPEGTRLFSVSTHTLAEKWFETDEHYRDKKTEVENFIFTQLEQNLQGFDRTKIIYKASATPKSWQDWTLRKFGRVGGLPNTMDKNVFDLIGSETDFKGLYLVGDTVYPGQGIAGVTLSGQNAVHRILQNQKTSAGDDAASQKRRNAVQQRAEQLLKNKKPKTSETA